MALIRLIINLFANISFRKQYLMESKLFISMILKSLAEEEEIARESVAG